MAGPVIPYINPPELPLGFLDYVPIITNWVDAADPPSIKPFGTLVALGVYIGSWISMNRARERGLSARQLSDFIFWVVASGFVISHIFDAITYHPETVLKDPLYLLKIWDGLSSWGGLMGAVGGALAWSWYRRQRVVEYIDVCVSAFPTAWVFGRSGCSVVHDHIGVASESFMAVQFPTPLGSAKQICGSTLFCFPEQFQGRLDLGLIEMLLTIPLAVTCHWLWRRNPTRANGFYVALTLCAYAPVRFVLDFMRAPPDTKALGGAVDPRYWGLTPAQWVCIGALALGLVFLSRTWKAKYVRVGALAPEDEEELEILPRRPGIAGYVGGGMALALGAFVYMFGDKVNPSMAEEWAPLALAIGGVYLLWQGFKDVAEAKHEQAKAKRKKKRKKKAAPVEDSVGDEPAEPKPKKKKKKKKKKRKKAKTAPLTPDP